MATADGDSVAAAGDPKIDGLLQGSQWDFGTGPHVLTYSFNITGLPGVAGWTAAQMAGVRAAFAAWSAVANIQFKEVKSGTYFYQSTADIALSLTGRTQQDKYGSVGEAIFPSASYGAAQVGDLLTDFAPGKTGVTYANPVGDIFFDNLKGDDVKVNNFAVLNPGGYTLELMLHEIGHALGLKHPHDDGGNGKPTFGDLGIGNLDSDYNTVMSYKNQGYYIDVSNPSTPMPLDILAMQYLYGVNRTTNTGNNTYYLRNNGNVQAIWDAGGYDTLDASGFGATTGVTIDLRPGAISTGISPRDSNIVSAVAMSYTPTETQDGAVGPIDNLIERAIGSSGNDSIYGNDANNTLLGGAGNDTLQDYAGDDVLSGGAGFDQLISNAGNDTLDGGAGADEMRGGTGDDTYIMDNVGDFIDERAGEGNDTVKTSVFLSSQIANIENYIYTGTSTAGWNLTGLDDNNYFATGAGKDNLTGGGGDDTLNGGSNADTLTGGTGDDTYVIDNVGDKVIENANEGNDTVRTSIALTQIIANVENYIYTGAANWTFSGTADDNLITGGSGKDVLSGGIGNDTLNGGTGADKLIGGQGDDTYYVDNAGDTVTEAVGEGTDVIKSSVTLNLGAGNLLNQAIENVILTGTAALNVTGNTIDNDLTGNDGANVIDGSIGADTMAGGFGNDTYVVDNAGDTVTENANAGIDTIKTSVASMTAVANVENYVFTGAGDWTFTGNDLNNTITSGGGKDKLDGGAGADTLSGGAGDDTYYLDNAGDKIVEAAKQGHDTVISSVSLNLAAGAFFGQEIEDVILATGSENLNVTGNALANVLTGNDGDNILNGGAGADIMTGGLGDDTYVVDNANDQVIEDADGGSDTVRTVFAIKDFITNIENYVYTGAVAWTFSGTDSDNLLGGGSGKDTLFGLGGDDVLDGGAGADILTGGLGDDTYVIDNVGDKVTELAGQGEDTIQASIAINLSTGALASQEIEDVTLTGTTAINATGNAFNNKLTGNAGANIIDGGLGADHMAGGLGNDTYIVDDAGDTVSENVDGGNDTIISSLLITSLTANVENYTYTGTSDWTFVGNDADNKITGSSGKDILDGGAGTDTLIGGLGDDTYYIDNPGDKVVEAAGQGNDTVVIETADGFVVPANVEKIILAGDIVGQGVIGNAASNTIIGNAEGNDMDGGAGADIMIGGAGHDAYFVDNLGDQVIENAGEGIDTVYTTAAITTGYANVEYYYYSGSATWSFTGSDANEQIGSFSGIAKLHGGGGDDTVFGASGADTLFGDDGDDYLDGGAGNDTLTGGAGKDNLDGNTGADTLIGGDGDDIYIVDNASDKVIETAGGGNDAVYTSAAKTIAFSNVENYFFNGSGNWTFVGSASDETITDYTDYTGSEIDTISGGGGDDTLVAQQGGSTIFDGGTGRDTLSFANFYGGATAFINLMADGTADSVTFRNVENLTGSKYGDFLYGDSEDNVLDGSGGNDLLAGRGGNDTYVFKDSGQIQIDNAVMGGTAPGSELDFGSSVTDQNLWFVQSGQDLTIDILGTTDKVSIIGWYGANQSAQLSEFVLADGTKLDNGSVSQLVTAMTTYATNNAGFNPVTANTTMSVDATVQSAITAAWHH